MTTTLSRIRSQDRAAWSGLWRDYLAFYDTTRPPTLYERNFAQLVQGNGPLHGWLARDADGIAVGLVHYFTHGTAWSFGDTCYLQDLYVDPSARGLGLGRKLIEAVYTRADAAGAPAVYWLTQDFNHEARLLYDRIAKVTPFIRYVRPL